MLNAWCGRRDLGEEAEQRLVESRRVLLLGPMTDAVKDHRPPQIRHMRFHRGTPQDVVQAAAHV